MGRYQYNRIKEVLDEKNKHVYWLQAQLEGETIPCVVRWCKNVKQPTIEQLFEIARVLDVDVRELLVSSKTQIKQENYTSEIDSLHKSEIDEEFSFDGLNPESVGLDGKQSFRYDKEGCDRITVFRDGYYSVTDLQGNTIVPPGKYTYIDGFDHNLARVKIDGMTSINNPNESTVDKWGLIDINDKEVLPLIYSEIWGFYKKGRKTTKVVEIDHKITGDGEPYTLKTIYKFSLLTKKLVETGYWIDDEYFETIEDNDSSSQYSVWDTLEDEPEAAGNIDYEG